MATQVMVGEGIASLATFRTGSNTLASDATFAARPPDHSGFGRMGRPVTWNSEKDKWTLITSHPT
jgi:hypothetical protein